MTVGAVAAVDLGASSGRVLVAHIGPDRLELVEARRFPNGPVRLPDGLHWDVLRLHSEILAGLRAAVEMAGDVAAVGIDGWGCDYGLLDAAGALLGNPYHYRDSRTESAVEHVKATVSPTHLYARTGIQFLPFNTIYQLAASRAAGQLDAAATMLLVPDLIGYWLTGQRVADVTNASTTALLDARTRTWAFDVIGSMGLPGSLFPGLREPGELVGGLLPDVLGETGLSVGARLALVATHDTASAVVAVPAEDADIAYISSGTWSLVGIELEAPILSEDSRAANFTNEAGLDGRVRYLRNVMGLWLLQESMRTWRLAGEELDLQALLANAAVLRAGGPVIDVDDAGFLSPGDMPARIRQWCHAHGQPAPETPAQVVRCILDSLAVAYARTVREVAELSGHRIRAIHIVGGGAQNRLLCQLTADACALPVMAGPVEAAAIGNALVQARALDLISGSLDALRALVRSSFAIERFEPRASGVAEVV